MHVNPYKSPKSLSALAVRRRRSMVRGLAWAILLGGYGFCVPFLVLGAVLLIQIMFGELTPFERAVGFRKLPMNGIGSAVVCSLMFAFSALANYSPCRGVGLIRSMVVMGSVALVALFATGVAAVALDIGPQSRGFDPCLWLRVTIFVVLLSAGGIAFTFWQIHRSENEPPSE